MALFGVAAWPGSQAAAFSVFSRVCAPSIYPCPSPQNPLDVAATLRDTPRWSNEPGLGRGLHDGIQVGVAPGSATAFGFVSADEVALFDAAARGAFAQWESAVLRFDLTFDAPGTVLDTGLAGYEIDFHPVTSAHPLFSGEAFFGVGWFHTEYTPERRLTNGMVVAGDAITGGDVLLATDRLDAITALLHLSPQEKANFFQRVLMHEVGHVLGLDHPNVAPDRNLDDDDDPLTRVRVDRLDPFVGMKVSENVDRDAVMSNSPPSYEAAFFTSLRPDDLSGRDVLYPVVPEPASALLG